MAIVKLRKQQSIRDAAACRGTSRVRIVQKMMTQKLCATSTSRSCRESIASARFTDYSADSKRVFYQLNGLSGFQCFNLNGILSQHRSNRIDIQYINFGESPSSSSSSSSSSHRTMYFIQCSSMMLMSNLRTNLLDVVQMAWECSVFHFLRFLSSHLSSILFT